MMSTIILIVGLGYFGYIFVGCLLCFAIDIAHGDWKDFYGGIGCVMNFTSWVGIILGIWSFIVGYGLKYLTYNNVNIVKECNNIGIIILVLSIIGIFVGKKIMKQVYGNEASIWRR